MEWLAELAIKIKQELWLISWRDVLEIAFFSILTYQTIRWLNQDKQKNLLLSFYSYTFLLFLSYYLNISGIFFILLVSSPILAMLFILLHQKTLQHNYIALQNKTTHATSSDRWIEEFLQTFLYGINRKKTLIGVIERQASLEPFFIARCTFKTPLSKELLTMLINSSDGTESTITFWINDKGTLYAINPHWNISTEDIWLNPEIKLSEKRFQDAAILAKKTDAVVITLTPENRLFSVLFDGKQYENISAGSAFSLIKQCTLPINNQRGLWYEPHQKSQPNQPQRNA